MSKYNIHSDYKKYSNKSAPLSPLLLPLMNALLAAAANRMPPAEGVRATKKKIAGYQNGLIGLTIFEPKDIKKNAPCLVYLHGGAFAMKEAPIHKNLVCEYALKTPCKVIFVDYRLAPKYPFPVGVEDCYAAFTWVCENAQALGIDPSRIALGGDSAGGALAAAVCLMARDRNAPRICFQMLIYPVTDARLNTQSMKDFIDTPMWNAKLNAKMWKLYLKNGVQGHREYASPAEAASLLGLPAAYVEVSEFDCLRDEGINFAQALEKCGIVVALNKTAGTVHGFEIAEKSEIVRECVARRIEELQKAFY